MENRDSNRERECPKCGMRQPAGDSCVKCGLVFAKYRSQVLPWSPDDIPEPPRQSGHSETISSVTTVYEDPDDSGHKVDAVTIIALLLLLNSILALFSKAAAFSRAFSETQYGFHDKAKYLYDMATMAAMFVSAVGLLKKRDWARIAMSALLALGLAEGLYMMLYAHVTIAELEKELQDNLPELRQHTPARLFGCALYAYFIYYLNSSGVRTGFRRLVSPCK